MISKYCDLLSPLIEVGASRSIVLGGLSESYANPVSPTVSRFGRYIITLNILRTEGPWFSYNFSVQPYIFSCRCTIQQRNYTRLMGNGQVKIWQFITSPIEVSVFLPSIR